MENIKFTLEYWIDDGIVREEPFEGTLENAIETVMAFSCPEYDQFAEENPRKEMDGFVSVVRDKREGAIFWANTDGESGTDCYDACTPEMRRVLDKYIR